MVEVQLEISDRRQWRAWLEQNHESDAIVWLVIYKRSTGREWITYQEALEEAICYGWIDSRMKRIDEEKHIIRFTKRKKGKAWSLTNLRKALKLIDEGKMTKFGLAMLPQDIEKEMKVATEQGEKELSIPDDLAKALGEADLMAAFHSLSPSNRRAYHRWITQAKRPETRQERIRQAVELIAKKELPMSMTKWRIESNKI
jgi:uncharacterized protein YdeI (YjbR/CyaY-like superfamily)